MRLNRPHCVGVTATATHPHEKAIAYSCSPDLLQLTPCSPHLTSGAEGLQISLLLRGVIIAENDIDGDIKVLTLKAENG